MLNSFLSIVFVVVAAAVVVAVVIHSIVDVAVALL